MHPVKVKMAPSCLTRYGSSLLPISSLWDPGADLKFNKVHKVGLWKSLLPLSFCLLQMPSSCYQPFLFRSSVLRLLGILRGRGRWSFVGHILPKETKTQGIYHQEKAFITKLIKTGINPKQITRILGQVGWQSWISIAYQLCWVWQHVRAWLSVRRSKLPIKPFKWM